MPYIDLLVYPAVTAEQSAALADGINDAMFTIMGKRREVTAVRVDSAENAHWTIGAKQCRGTTAYMEVRITTGTNSPEQKTALVQSLNSLLVSHLSDLAEASYIVIHEIPAENWGYAGITQAVRLGNTYQGA